MKLFLILVLIIASTFSFAQTDDGIEVHPLEGKIELMVNDELVENLELLDNENFDESLYENLYENHSQISWEEGYLLVNQEDYGVWDFSHILAVRIRQTADDTYSFDATVRHRDEGWDHYADLFRIVPTLQKEIKADESNEDATNSVENGDRILGHPHDTEQPFTRSQSGVVATGVVCIEAKDTVHEWGGSSLCLNLDKLDFSNSPIEISWELKK